MDTLHEYVRENKLHLVQEFIGSHPECRAKSDADGRTPLMWALSETQNVELARALLGPGTDIDAADSAGYTALHIAAAIGAELTSLVLAQSPQVDSRTTTGQTPLMLGVSKQHLRVVELLLDAGASPKAKDRRQVTPLMRAVAVGSGSLTELLLARGAAVNATDSQGWSAAHYAYAEGRKDVLDVLVAHGADLNKRSREEELPRDVAPLGFSYK